MLLTRTNTSLQISPGGQSWAEPVPLPTPPQQISPREPGVAYIYNYGSSGGSAVQPLPPLNYVAVAPPTSEGAPSPTPSALASGQPVIYHYSYHYTIQPGQQLPEGAAHPPNSPPPALQIAQPPATGFSQTTSSTNRINKSSTVKETHQTSSTSRHHSTSRTGDDRPKEEPTSLYPSNRRPTYPGDDKPGGPTSINYSVNTTNYKTETHHHPFPTTPDKTSGDPRHPSSQHPNDPNRNITININKTTTHTTHTTTRDGEYPEGIIPVTSTPYRGSSRSPDRHYPNEPRYPGPGPNDSLERVRKHPQPGLPFPDASPVKPQDGTRIPRKVDDLMSEFPEKVSQYMSEKG